jgi:SAM-dependent methyltransferase
MRPHDWSGFAALAAGALSLVEIARGDATRALGWFLAAMVAGVVTRHWSVSHPAPMPHLLRWTLAVPRGNHSPEHLKRILAPQSGERLLEIGPGTGVHAVPVASSLAPDGVLDVLDVQQEMLDDVIRRAHEAGVDNIAARRGDAHKLPYPDGTFDGAYLVGVLGEIPDQGAALRELRRVLKPSGRVVIGEVFFDPDFVLFSSLKRHAERASFAFQWRIGGSLSYLARFRPVSLRDGLDLSTPSGRLN